MRLQRTFALLAAVVAVAILVAPAGAITYSVGPNPGDINSPDVVVNSTGGPFGPVSFALSAGVDQDPAADSLLKAFTNDTGGGISSGQNASIVETFSNDGTEAWVAWDELVVSTTDLPPPSPGFLFDTSVTVLRDGVPLSQGVDYTLVGVPYPNGNNNGYLSIKITFSPASYIQPGNVLEIQKSIHEVFSDGNIWQQGEAALVAQYPTAVPEPASLGLLALGAASVLSRRQRRRDQTA